MIIVITNRNLPVIPNNQSVDINVSSLGVGLGAKIDNQNRIFTGEFLPDANDNPQYRKLTFQPRGSESVVFEKITPEEREKPWVFFVHGFHQDPAENIDKAIALQDNHDVNVIAFAWPSRPLDETIAWGDALKAGAKDALNGMTWGGMLSGVLLNKVKGQIKDTWSNYPPAIANAEKSNVDLIAALDLVNHQLKLKQPPVLLIHSMGNYLLENTMKYISELPMKFNNIVLHEADATVPGFEWVKKLNTNLADKNKSRLYITTNEEDYVLLGSKGRRAILKKLGTLRGNGSTERLGRYIENHVLGDIHYLDFSFGEFINDEHEFFKLSSIATNPHVHACLGRIFRAENDGLPANKDESGGGFSKMPTDAHLYRLEEIIHITDVDERREDIVPVKSLDEFKKQQASGNSDLDDEDMFGSD